MNLHVARGCFWLRVGRYGVAAYAASEPAIDAWAVASFDFLGARIRLLHLP